MRNGSVTTLVLALGLVGASACADARDHAAASRAAVTDSAGVILAELPANLSDLVNPRLHLERRYRIGTDDSNLHLFRVSGAKFLADGRLVIGNGGVQRIALMDSLGGVHMRFGGRGEGPGEFSSVTSVHVPEPGTIIVFDDVLGRLTQFDTTGQLLDTRQRMEPRHVFTVEPLIASMSGPLVGVYWENRVFGEGHIVHDTTPLLRYPADATRPDTLSLWRLKIWSMDRVALGAMRVELAFGPNLLSAGQVDRFALADTHEARVWVLDEYGDLTMQVRWGETAAPVTEVDVERFRAERDAELSEGMPDEIRREFLEVPHYETRPVLEGMALDRAGAVWIAPASLRTGDSQTWLVVDREGSVRGGARLPAGSRILDVRDGWLAAYERGEYDVETISVYRVTERAGETRD